MPESPSFLSLGWEASERRLSLNDMEVTSHFEKKVWVCVSDPLDVNKLAIKVIEALGDTVPAATVTQWEALHQQLSRSLQDKKILLVLDDVWTEDERAWEKIKLSLNLCLIGSRVIVTTRSEVVSFTVGSSYKHDLSVLSDEYCWLLFKSHAFNRSGDTILPKLEGIGRKISDKCKGVPLFAKALGSLMPHKKNAEEWQDVLDSDLWELGKVNKDILPAFMLSYIALPSHLKRCFTYCVLYEKDWRYEKNYIVKQWMSQGFILPSRLRDTEMIGREIFNDLVSRSFFHDLETDNNGNVSCKMHDFVHDFASFVSNNECRYMEGADTGSDHTKIRHLSFKVPDNVATYILPSIPNPDHLRNLLVWVSHSRPKLDISLLHQLKCLRTLDLACVAIELLPNEIGSLIHLRYLDLSETKVVELPEIVSDLRNLQTLKLNSCEVLRHLPRGIGNLINLRHLEIDYTYSLECLPQGLGRLKHLQTLSKFIMNEEGCQLRELGCLNKLKGRLWIGDIKGASKVAGDAKLKHKPYLSRLELTFKKEDYEGKSVHDTSVLDLLEPHLNLEDLRILNYSGSKFPTWMEFLTNISKLIIDDSCNVKVLPSFTGLISLKCLQLGGLDLISPTALFSDTYLKLKKLVIREMKYWEEWEIETFGDTTIIMPSLQLLVIQYCPKLKSLPRQILSDSLTKMEISACPELTISYLPSLLEELDLWEDAGSLSTSLPFHNNTTLKELGINDSPHSSLPRGISQLKALQVLNIQDCNSLTCIVEDIQHITLLEELIIWDCPNLEGDWSILSHISQIWIDNDRIK